MEHLSFIKLYEAYCRSSVNKRNKGEVLRFTMDLESNLCNIMSSLKNLSYVSSKYKSFVIYEPKERVIKALPFKDRVVQQWYVYEFIIPYIVPRFISDSYACIKGRGTHLAVYTLQKYMRKMRARYGDYYVLKCDIRKYFYSVNKDILYKIMKKYIRDKMLLELTYKLIFDGEDKGISVGNYTSQYFANIYLNELDYYVKMKLGIKYYVRYMDDFVILLRSKEEVVDVFNKIRIFLSSFLDLELNSKSRYYKSKMGVNFCGYIIHEDFKLLRNRSKRNIKKKVNKWNRDCCFSDINRIRMEYNSFVSYSKHADSYRFRKKIYDSILLRDYLDKK